MILPSFEPVDQCATFYDTLNHLIPLSTFSKNLSPQKIFEREFKLAIQKYMYSPRDFLTNFCASFSLCSSELI